MYSISIPPRTSDFMMIPIIIEKAFSQEECNKLLDCLNSASLKLKEDSGNVRSCILDRIAGLDWFYQKIISIVMKVNTYYNFDITEISMFSYLEYTQGSFMRKHYDIGDSEDESLTDTFRTRKITMSFLLSDNTEFQGGKLKFFPETDIKQEQGTIIAYPSYIYHEVEPLISGIRKVLLVSVNGPVFQ